MAIKIDIRNVLENAINRRDNWKNGEVNWSYVESDLLCELDNKYRDSTLLKSLEQFKKEFSTRI